MRKGDEGYEAARLAAIWNARKPERYPDVIVLAKTDDDVCEAVRLAAAEGLKVSVRSGGHSWVGNGIRDGGLLIDLSSFTEATVDPDARIARVQPAAKGPQLNELLLGHGLFFPTGHAPTVGIGGFILGGGYGWNSRYHGPACLSILAIDVVLADGSLIHADDDNHPDLLWAARGSGPGFFGVVTRFYLRVYPAPTRIRRSVHVYPIELRDQVLAWTYDHLDDFSPAVETSAKVGFTPGTDDRAVSLTYTAFCTEETGDRLLEPLEVIPFRDRALRTSIEVETTLAELYTAADRLTPPGRRWALDGIWMDGGVEEILTATRPILDSIPDGESFLLWMLWGHFPEQPNACWSSQSKLYFSPNSGWTDPSEDLVHEEWVHGTLADIQEHSHGIQFSDNNVADRPDDGISPDAMARLEAIRTRYDPEARFRGYMLPEESTTAYGASRR